MNVDPPHKRQSSTPVEPQEPQQPHKHGSPDGQEMDTPPPPTHPATPTYADGWPLIEDRLTRFLVCSWRGHSRGRGGDRRPFCGRCAKALAFPDPREGEGVRS